MPVASVARWRTELASLKRVDTLVLREAYVVCLVNGDRLGLLHLNSKLYALNRALFRVPDGNSSKGLPFIGEGDYYDRWPVISRKGDLEGIHLVRDQVSFYEPLAEFDKFRAAWGRW